MSSITRGFLIIGSIGVMSSGAYSIKVINNLPPHYTIRVAWEINQFYYGSSKPLASQPLSRFPSTLMLASSPVKNIGTSSIKMDEKIRDTGAGSYHNYVADKVTKPSQIYFNIGDTSKPASVPGAVDYVASGPFPFVNRHGRQLHTTYTIDFQPGTTNIQVTPS